MLIRCFYKFLSLRSKVGFGRFVVQIEQIFSCFFSHFYWEVMWSFTVQWLPLVSYALSGLLKVLVFPFIIFHYLLTSNNPLGLFPYWFPASRIRTIVFTVSTQVFLALLALDIETPIKAALLLWNKKIASCDSFNSERCLHQSTPTPFM